MFSMALHTNLHDDGSLKVVNGVWSPLQELLVLYNQRWKRLVSTACSGLFYIFTLFNPRCHAALKFRIVRQKSKQEKSR